MSLVGPLRDPSGVLRGLMIMSGDQAVLEDDLRPDPYLSHRNMVFEAVPLELAKGAPRGKPDPSSIREHRLVLLVPVPGTSPEPTTRAKQEVWLKSATNGFALTGKFGDRQVLAVQSTDTLKILAAACRAPLVQAGFYRPLVFAAWFSKESLG